MKPASWLGGLVLLILWEMICRLHLVSPSLLAPPAEVGQALLELCTQGMPPGHLLPLHIKASLIRVFSGFFVAVLLGIPLGLALGACTGLRRFLSPLLTFFRPIPPLAWVPLAILWFGLDLPSAAFLIFLGAFFPIVINTCVGVQNVPTRYGEAVRMLGGRPRHIWLKVLLPGALPAVLTGIRIAMGVAWMTLVAAEMTGVRNGYGLGYMLMSARDLHRIDEIMAGMVTIGLVGLAIEWLLSRLTRTLLHWS